MNQQITHELDVFQILYTANRMITNSGMPGLLKIVEDDPNIQEGWRARAAMSMRHVDLSIRFYDDSVSCRIKVQGDKHTGPLNSCYNGRVISVIWHDILVLNGLGDLHIEAVQKDGMIRSEVKAKAVLSNLSAAALIAAGAIALMVATNDLSRGF